MEVIRHTFALDMANESSACQHPGRGFCGLVPAEGLEPPANDLADDRLAVYKGQAR